MFELNKDTLEILGRPNFACRGIANALRAQGTEIPYKAEMEQAHAIHWMLCLYEKHGEKWADEGDKILKEIGEQVKVAHDWKVDPEGGRCVCQNCGKTHPDVAPPPMTDSACPNVE